MNFLTSLQKGPGEMHSHIAGNLYITRSKIGTWALVLLHDIISNANAKRKFL